MDWIFAGMPALLTMRCAGARHPMKNGQIPLSRRREVTYIEAAGCRMGLAIRS
jgi:hypothetical protein